MDEFVEPPDESDPVELWVEYAVSRGFRRDIAASMPKTDLIKALIRLESSYDDAVY